MKPRRLATLVVLAFITTACSGGGNSSPLSQTPATSGMVAASDGFSFPNFGAANTKELMDGEDLRIMFGDGVCTNGTATPCSPTAEAAAWAQMVNQSRQAGHCEGMVVQAIHRYTTKASPKTVDLTNDNDTTNGIIRAFATQFFPVVRKESDSWAKKSINDILSELTKSFSSSAMTYSMGLYTDKGGHAVLPLSIEYPTETTAKVNIYDSNWPGANRYVMFDLEAETWTFSFSGRDPEKDPNPWTGGKGDIDLTSMESRTQSSAPFDSGSNTVTGNFLVIRSTQPTWSITTSDGTVTPTESTSPTSTVRALRNSTSATLREHVVFTDSIEIDVQLPAATSAYVVSNNKVVSVISKGGAETIAITADSIDVPSSAQVSIAVENLAATVQGGNALIDFQPSAITITPDGNTQPVVVNSQRPAATVTISGSSVKTSSSSPITDSEPSLPSELLPADTKAGLSPQSERALGTSNSPQTTTTTTTAAGTTNSSTTIVPVTTTSVVQNTNIVALQFMGSLGPWRNGQPLEPYVFRFINNQDQWANTASGSCTLTLLPELDNGSLGGASLSGNTTATANGTGQCEFSGVIINGTPNTKYRIRAQLSGGSAFTILGPATLTN